jgi:hypothetical protein
MGQQEQHYEELLDEALEETFPASDPPAPFHPARGEMVPVRAQQAVSN